MKDLSSAGALRTLGFNQSDRRREKLASTQIVDGGDLCAKYVVGGLVTRFGASRRCRNLCWPR